MSTSRPDSNRIPSLDGMRAVSIMVVLFAHAFQTKNFPTLSVHRLSLLADGKLGVRVFFVISGFLITTLLLKEKAKTGRISLTAFYKRRVLRILPVYYFYILVIAIVCGLMLHEIPASTYISASTFTTNWWGVWSKPFTWPLEHTWSLAMEEQFYLTWPVLLACAGPRFAGRIWIPILMLMPPCLRFFMWHDPLMDHLFYFQGDSIASGCLLAFLLDRRRPQMSKIFGFFPALFRATALVLIFLNILLASACRRLDIPFPLHLFVMLHPTVQCISICYLMGSWVLNQNGVSYWLLNLAFVQWIGRLSYSLYIWQQIALIPHTANTFPDQWSLAQWATTFPQNLGFVFLLAMLSYYCLEQPMLRLKAHFAKIPAVH
ncbi:MAG TPA: acyltransferase [Verrucomicrobiae bacterium]|jgi:peptidoglycan/LPS O-acetylase OafA/YrhL|nr:acyltransferase [Verrucomicrobiae bacterium]